MFKRLMSLGLLCLAFDASASIIVTTTADENGTNPSACSLREALAITNSSDLKAGFGGCVNPDSSTVIILTAKSTYPLNSELIINQNVTIQSSTSGGFINTTDGSDNPIVQAIGKHRILNILATASSTPTVAITNVNLSGCGGSTICETQGGIIINQGLLTLSSMRIYNGVADRGGAIYNENIGKLTITNAELKNNTAKEKGAAIYSIQPAFFVSKTLMRENKVENAAETGFVIDTEKNDPVVGSVAALVTSTTIYNNRATAVNIVAGVGVVSATIIGNQGGVTLNAKPNTVTTITTSTTTGTIGTTTTTNGNTTTIVEITATGTKTTVITTTITSALVNSIIGENNGDDCAFKTDDKTPLSNIAYTNSCDDSVNLDGTFKYGKFTDGQDLYGKRLIAGDPSVTDGSAVCDLPRAGSAGLLCPFRIYKGQFTGYFLPRLVPAFGGTLASEQIVNKGVQGCGIDQRGLSRTICDIGAVELVIPAGNAQKNGQDIVFGQTATIDLSPVVGDGQLIPADYCDDLYQTSSPPQGGVWLDGCIRYVTQPSRGVAAFDALKNVLTYTPSSNFHGYDKFSYTITTSTSFFSEGENNQTITLTTTIVQAPPTGITSKTVGAGGVGVFAVFVLMGLAMRRRLTGGQS